MRLLIVEDEPDLRSSLLRAFRDEGYACDSAADGESGLFMALNTEYDAVLLDIMLPRVSGWEILERIRAVKKTPVLMLTARDALDDRIRGLDSGADDYVLKPFELGELIARVRALIRRAANTAEPVLQISDVTVDTVSRTVHKSADVAPLTPREYALVEYLALHRGTVVSRTTLYEHLFDENDNSLSNLLDVYVSNIRRKLGHEFIKTRRGHGYLIEAAQ